LIPTSADAAKPVDKGGLLFRLLRDERLEGFEKSFKMADRSLLANRCLMGLSRSRIAPQKLLDICRKLAMPERFLAAFQERLPEADTVHFGFEEGESGFIYKVYLEFARRLYQALASGPRAAGSDAAEPLLLHLAYKWDALERGKSTVAEYRCYPQLSGQAMLERMARIYSGHKDNVAFDAVKGMLALASGRTAEALMYLEVSEQGNPRLSFDINLHAADLRLHEIEPFLSLLCTHYSIPAAQFARMFAQVRTQKLGHVAGGISREGRDFLTVYHEVGVH